MFASEAVCVSDSRDTIQIHPERRNSHIESREMSTERDAAERMVEERGGGAKRQRKGITEGLAHLPHSQGNKPSVSPAQVESTFQSLKKQIQVHTRRSPRMFRSSTNFMQPADSCRMNRAGIRVGY